MAWFTFTDASEEVFVVRIDDPLAVAHARGLLAGTENGERLIGGIVVADPAAYNIGWSYHLDPDSVFFFDFSIEIGDATMRYIEEHLDEVGGAFLPTGRWTPWTAVLQDELQARFGGDGGDVLVGSRGADLVFGKGGNDWLIGAAGDDHLAGGAGHDRVFGGSGDDKLGGGSGNDVLRGGAGRDVLAGDDGTDRLHGGSGNDDLLGGDGEDQLYGGAGDDTLVGGFGRDQLTGGAGADNFKFIAITDSGPEVSQRDVITDFTPGRDQIDLSVIDTDPDVEDDQAFTFIGSLPFSAPGQVRFSVSNGTTTVFVNADLDPGHEMAVNLIGEISLTFDDFIL